MPQASDAEEIVLDGGHVLFIAALEGRPRSTCILVHQRWVNDVKLEFGQLTGRIAYLDVWCFGSCMRLVSAHLPHSGYSDVEYAAAMSALDDVESVTRAPARPCIVGLDGNAVIGQRTNLDCTCCIGNHGLGSRCSRGDQLCFFAHSAYLTVVNTCFCKRVEYVWTHKAWSTGTTRQIDYIMVCPS